MHGIMIKTTIGSYFTLKNACHQLSDWHFHNTRNSFHISFPGTPAQWHYAPWESKPCQSSSTALLLLLLYAPPADIHNSIAKVMKPKLKHRQLELEPGRGWKPQLLQESRRIPQASFQDDFLIPELVNGNSCYLGDFAGGREPKEVRLMLDFPSPLERASILISVIAAGIEIVQRSIWACVFKSLEKLSQLTLIVYYTHPKIHIFVLEIFWIMSHQCFQVVIKQFQPILFPFDIHSHSQNHQNQVIQTSLKLKPALA
nr:hypothetical protein [Pseudomonas sp. MYb185]